MPLMRVGIQPVESGYTHFSLKISSDSHRISAWSSLRDQSMPSCLRSLKRNESRSNTWMMPGRLLRLMGTFLPFFQQRLPPNEFRHYVKALVVKAEGLLQWAAVTSQLILDPPACFSYSNSKCMNHLLEPNTNCHGQDLLDGLYKDVMEGYFTSQEARDLFCSTIRPVTTSIEPLTVRS
jgi:hypothetical protein